MRLLLVFLLTVAAFAQHSRGSAPRSYSGGGSPSRGPTPSGYTLNSFGNSVYPGGLPSSIAPPRPSNPNAAFRGNTYRAPHPQHGRTVVVPYPVYLGYGAFGYGGYLGGLSPEQPPVPQGYGYDAYGQPPQQQPPVVIINQGYRPEVVNPQFRDYSNADLPEPMPPPSMTVYGNNATDPNRRRDDDKPTIYLIALKEGSVMPALAFWVDKDNDTLNYITREGSHNRVSLDRVDRDFSQRLNRERNLEFRIP